MTATSDTHDRSHTLRSTALAGLVALVAALFVVAVPVPGEATSHGPTEFGNQDSDFCTEFYFEYTDGHTDWFRVCQEGEDNGQINNVEAGASYGVSGGKATVPGLHVPFLHVSCSDRFDVFRDVGEHDAAPGFDSDGGSTLSGHLLASTTGDADGDPAFRLERQQGGMDEACQNVEFPEPDPDPDPGAIDVTKDLAEGSEWPEGGTFTFVLYDGETELDSGDATETTPTVTFDELDAGDYTVCEEDLDEDWELVSVTVGDDSVADDGGCVDVTVGEGQTVVVVFTNEFDEPVDPGETPVGTITITKAVAGNQAPDDAEFVFAIDCGEEFSESGIELGDGGEYTSPEIEADTECTVTETNTGDALTVTVDGESGTSADVTVPDDDTVTVAFVNDFGDGGVPPGGPGERVDDDDDDVDEEDDVDDEEEVVEAVLPVAIDAGSGGLATSGMPAFILALMALGALMLGSGAIAARRRI